MADEQKQNPANEESTDVSKAQAAQQPTGQAGQQAEFGEQRQPAETGQDQSEDQAAESLEGETATRQDTDIEGASSEEKGEAESGFVGSRSEADGSGELVEDEDFAKGGQGAPDDK